MKTLIVLECERYIQPFMRAMLNVAQEHYDKIIIITNPLKKGDSINSDKISHIEIDNKTRKKAIITAPFKFFTKDSLLQTLKCIAQGRLNNEYLKYLKLYLCYGTAFYKTALPYVKEALKNGELHMLSCWFYVDAWTVGKFKKKFPQIKAYSLAHSFEIDPLKNNFVDLTFNEWKHKYLDKIFFISNKMLKIYNETTHQKFAKKYAEQMKVSYLGCIKLFDGVNPYHNDGKIKLVSCSYVHPVKRIDLIMDTLKELKIHPIEWVHMGNGILLDEMRQIASKVMEENSNITIDFKGYVSNEDVQKYYTEEKVDIFINLSSSEGVPVAIMEAIAYGIPVIATDVGGVSEIIDENHGLLIAANAKAEDIKKELEKFIDIYTRNAENMRISAHKFWKLRFDANKNYNSFFNSL